MIGAAGAEASAATPYSTAPMPPARVSNPIAARTTVGSTPQRSAQPPATPATSRSELRGTRGNERWMDHRSHRRTPDPERASGASPNPRRHDQGHPRWCAGRRLRTVERMNPSAPTTEPGDDTSASNSTGNVTGSRPVPGPRRVASPSTTTGSWAVSPASSPDVSGSTRCGSASPSCCWPWRAVSAWCSTSGCGWC